MFREQNVVLGNYRINAQALIVNLEGQVYVLQTENERLRAQMLDEQKDLTSCCT